MYPNRGISKCYLCLLVHIECNKITLITLPSLWQEFSDITCEIFDLAFTCNFPNFLGLYQLVQGSKSFCRFADVGGLREVETKQWKYPCGVHHHPGHPPQVWMWRAQWILGGGCTPQLMPSLGPWAMLMFDVHHYCHPCHLNEVRYYKCHNHKRHELSYWF